LHNIIIPKKLIRTTPRTKMGLRCSAPTLIRSFRVTRREDSQSRFNGHLMYRMINSNNLKMNLLATTTNSMRTLMPTRSSTLLNNTLMVQLVFQEAMHIR
jgi:hypothetical protein